MSVWKDPVGPKGKGVYVRRRLLALAGLLAIIAAIVLIVLKPGSTGGTASSRDVEVPEDLVAVEQAESAQAAAEVPDCAAGQLAVTPLTDGGSYAAGELPKLSLTVANTGTEACAADLGTATMTFTISSGSDEVWRSTDCQQNPDHRTVVLEPGKDLATEAIEWDRTRSSAETCDIVRDSVDAGGASYHLRVAAAGVEGAGTAQFLLY